ncbi:MAG: DUF2839 domain-containing protein [Pseudanabaenaceae cyanobacterium SKYGB_i_bin29]|nr:DUF2839 domain-containing protein [Pseudanabaenaceae cyanobacterium SKYG29]MDW8420853.1 DUF2839 domain-containing protein [Pseudanabaenaceae cyanobacterium SKYGB_i_bin29]
MGDSKRRKEILGENYGKPQPIVAWLPWLTKDRADQFVKITTTGAWIGIGAMVVVWVTVRFIGPSLGWWTLVNQ